jgi:hypothetical protein
VCQKGGERKKEKKENFWGYKELKKQEKGFSDLRNEGLDPHISF